MAPEQLDLFKMSRATDPDTSHEAARDMTLGGNAQYQRDLCYAAVLEKPGQTAAEIAIMVGLERHAPSRRLPELRRKLKVTNGINPRERSRICNVTGRRSVTWWPKEDLCA